MTSYFRLRKVLPAIIALSTLPTQAGLVLVENGRPRARIVVQREEPKAQKAAEELRDYLEKMSGAALPLATEGAPSEGEFPVTIHIGATDAVRAMNLDIPAGFDPTPRPDAFEEEGYRIRTGADFLVLAGNNDGPYHGALYAVYDLLRDLGCRWYFPGEWGEIVPERATIEIEPMDILSRPDFALRSVNIGGWLPSSREEKAAYTEWQLRVGMTPDTRNFYPVAGDGFLAMLVDPNEHFEDHPEYFAMNEQGERHRGRSVRHTMLCLSNEEVFETAVRTVRELKEGTRKNSWFTTGIGISPPDGVPYCYCEDCQKASQNFRFPRYVHRTTQSEEFFGFAARLAREFPDLFIGTMAYSLREIVPQGVDIPPNMAVCVAPISCDVLHPNDSKLWRRRDFMRNLRRWRGKTPHVYIYDYNPGFLLGNWAPERDAANLAINIPIYRKLDIKGLTREGRKAFMQTWISNYVMARMLWDADTDLDALKTDFYTTFFGPDAGPHVRAWWDACEEALVSATIQAHEDWLVNHIYTGDFARSLRIHVEAAQAAQTTPAQKERVDAFALIADHLLAYGEANDAEKAMDYARAADACARMLQRERELHEIYSFFHEYRNEAHARRAYFPGGREDKLRDLAARTNGETGERVAPVPLEAAFRRDPFNEGIVAGWYEADFDPKGWETRNTYYTWDQQEEPLDAAGHDYDGYGWYRFTFDLPEKFDGRPLRLYLGGLINEGWVWVNGDYAGHKAHKLWWGGPHDLDLDITSLARPGAENSVTIRVWNDADIGGLYRRGFVYALNPEE